MPQPTSSTQRGNTNTSRGVSTSGASLAQASADDHVPEFAAVEYEERRLPPLDNPDAYPRTYRETRKAPYLAAVTRDISDVRFDLDPAVLADADDASMAVARFDAEFSELPMPFTSVLLRSESASSSQIENLPASARAIAEAAIGERAEGNGPLIVSNAAAMSAAIELADTMDSAGVIAMQRVLLGAHRPELTGSFRAEQVWIGGRLPHEATFVPPHHDRVPAAMEDLMAFASRSNMPVLAHTALTHAQFETIHPFCDGNGRTGRALIQAMLRHGGLTTGTFAPVSAGLLGDLGAYFSALDAWRSGDPNAIVSVFAAATMQALSNACQLALRLRQLCAEWDSRLSDLRSDAAARRLATATIGQPVVNLTVAMSQSGVSQQATHNALSQLVEREILVAGNSKRRNRIWINRYVIDALDEFAARSTRQRPSQGHSTQS